MVFDGVICSKVKITNQSSRSWNENIPFRLGCGCMLQGHVNVLNCRKTAQNVHVAKVVGSTSSESFSAVLI